MRPLEITRSGVVGTIAVFVVAAICVRLGIWQLHRREGRLARNHVIEQRMQSAPLPLTALPQDTTGLTYRRAEVTGRYDSDRTIVLAGRSHESAPGVHVYAPLRLAPGAILVNRGWMPARDAATVDLSLVRVDTTVRVEGVLLPFPASHRERADDGFRDRWFRLDGEGIRAQYPYPVAPLYLLATSPGDSLPVRLAPPTLDAGPHLSYAIQWFSFATIFLVGWATILLRRGEGERGGGPPS